MTIIEDKKRGITRRNLMGCVLIPGKHIQKVYLDLNSKDDLITPYDNTANNTSDDKTTNNTANTTPETQTAK